MTDSSLHQELPEVLEAIFAQSSNPDAVFTALMPALCQVWQCDRCFLAIQDPHTARGWITHCWSNDPRLDLTGSGWVDEANIATKDPLMAIAFRTPKAVFVEDVETAGSEIVNLNYEREQFKHRALIHAPIYQDGLMWGILEPSVFEPRIWTEFDRWITIQMQAKLAPLVIAYARTLGV